MLSLQEATIVAKDYLKKIKTTPPVEVSLLETNTKEFELGWIFFYQSKEFIETGNIFSSLAGNGAIILNKYDGTIHETGSAHPVEYYLKEYLQTIKR